MKKTIDKSTIGGRIKAARKELGMTQEDLAEMMCITGALVCCYEKDKVDLPLSVIKELAMHLKVSVSYLVNDIDSKFDEECQELLRLFGNIKSDEARQVALVQIKALGLL